MRLIPLLVILLALGCRGNDPRSSPTSRTPAGSALGAGGSASTDPWTTDPWQVEAAAADAPPDLTARKQLANEACPTVSAPYFYRIEKAGKVSHILGTRHIGVPLSKFPRAVQDAVGTAKLAVFEVAPDDDSGTEQPEIALPDELGPELWRHYRTLVGTEVASSLERATPAEALLMMMVMYEDMGAMLDMEIQNQVVAAKVPTKGLETSAFQDVLLEKILDIRMLRASIKTTQTRKELEQESRDDLEEYCAGTDEVPGMDDELRRDLLASGYTAAELDRIDEEMVFARNADWIPKLEPILKTGGAFIAVGADHLTGPRGVIALLAKRGFKTTRVK